MLRGRLLFSNNTKFQLQRFGRPPPSYLDLFWCGGGFIWIYFGLFMLFNTEVSINGSGPDILSPVLLNREVWTLLTFGQEPPTKTCLVQITQR